MTTDRDKLDRLIERVEREAEATTWSYDDPLRADLRSLLALVEAGREMNTWGHEPGPAGVGRRCRFCKKPRRGGTIKHLGPCPRLAYDAAVREIREPGE